MSIALSTTHGFATGASLLLLIFTAACSGEHPFRPQSNMTNANIIGVSGPAGSPHTTTTMREHDRNNRIISLAEEEESHAITPSEQGKPHYTGTYGFYSAY